MRNAAPGQDDCMDFLMKSTGVAELKAASLLSIGCLCRKQGTHLSHRSDDLVAVLSDVLLTKSQKKRRGVPSEALTCISDMVCGMGACQNEDDMSVLKPYQHMFVLLCACAHHCACLPLSLTITHTPGVSFHYRVLGLLGAMLGAGLTEDLIAALGVITSNMPMHKEVVHTRLLAEIVKVLEEILQGA
jgi:hypothetical protein